MTPIENEMTTNTDGSDADVPTYVISPSPVLWADEFEGSNPRPGKPPIWRELMLRSRQRGSKVLGKMDWPGQVLLPSTVVGKLLSQKRLNVPDRWRTMFQHDLTRFIALLNAWYVERLLFDFTALAGEIVLNSQVTAPLSPQAFSLMPAHAIYIDFESLDFRDRHLPGGAFVGLNVNETNGLELVLAIDRFESVQVHTFDLDGQSLETIMERLLKAARKSGKSAEEQSHVVTFIDHHVHTLLSAVLMVCSSHACLEHVVDGVSRENGQGLWTRWRIGKAFTETLNSAYSNAIRDSGCRAPVVVAEWVDPGANALANLRCSIRTPADVSAAIGMPGALRNGPSLVR